MKQLNEIKRMQQLAGINEIKIDNPTKLSAKVIKIKRDDNDGDVAFIDFYIANKKVASGAGEPISPTVYSYVTIDTKDYPEFRQLLNHNKINNDETWGLITIPELNSEYIDIDYIKVRGYWAEMGEL